MYNNSAIFLILDCNLLIILRIANIM